MSKLIERELTKRDIGSRAARVDEGYVADYVNSFAEGGTWQAKKDNDVRLRIADTIVERDAAAFLQCDE
jgi:hypothetical protein